MSIVQPTPSTEKPFEALKKWISDISPSDSSSDEHTEVSSIIMGAVRSLDKTSLESYLSCNLDKFSNIDRFFQFCWDGELSWRVDETFFECEPPRWDPATTPRFWAFFAYERWRTSCSNNHACLAFNSARTEDAAIQEIHESAELHRCAVCGGKHPIMRTSLVDESVTECETWKTIQCEFKLLHDEMFPANVFSKLGKLIPTESEFEIAFFPHHSKIRCAARLEKTFEWFNPRAFEKRWNHQVRKITTTACAPTPLRDVSSCINTCHHGLSDNNNNNNINNLVADQNRCRPREQCEVNGDDGGSNESNHNNNDDGDDDEDDGNCIDALNLDQKQKSRCIEHYRRYVTRLMERQVPRVDVQRMTPPPHRVELYATRDGDLLVFSSGGYWRDRFSPWPIFPHHRVVPGIFFRRDTLDFANLDNCGIDAMVRMFQVRKIDAEKVEAYRCCQPPAFRREVNAYARTFKSEFLCSTTGPFSTAEPYSETWYFIATRVQGDDLGKLLASLDDITSPRLRFDLARQAMRLVQSVHDFQLQGHMASFVHGDIKPAHFVCKVAKPTSDSAEEVEPELTLTGFEFPSIRCDMGRAFKSGYGMTPYWCSPAKERSAVQIKAAAPDDIFSFALVLYEIFHFRHELIRVRRGDVRLPQFWIDYFSERYYREMTDNDEREWRLATEFPVFWESELKFLYPRVPGSGLRSFTPPSIPSRCDPLLATLMNAMFRYYQENHTLTTLESWIAVTPDETGDVDDYWTHTFNPPTFSFRKNFLFYTASAVAELVTKLAKRLSDVTANASPSGIKDLAGIIRSNRRCYHSSSRSLEPKASRHECSLLGAVILLCRSIDKLPHGSSERGGVVRTYMEVYPYVLADLQQCLYELEAQGKYFFDVIDEEIIIFDPSGR